MKVASARSAWARTAIVIPGGTRCRTTTVGVVVRGDRIGEADRELCVGPPRTGTRTRLISREPRCLTTAMSHGDSRTTSSMVGEKTVGPPLWPSLPIGALPPQPKMMRSASCSADASMIPSGGVLPDAHDRVDRRAVRGVVEHLLQQSPGVPGPRRAFGQRHALGHFLDDPQRRQLAGLGSSMVAPRPISSSAVRVRDRDQDRDGSGDFGLIWMRRWRRSSAG